MLAGRLAELLGVPIEGDAGAEITSAAPLETAGHGQISFVSGPKAFKAARESGAACLIVPIAFAAEETKATLLRAREPRGTFAAAVALLHPPKPVRPGVHPTAAIDEGATVDPTCEVAAGASIGSGSMVGPGCRIGPNCSIGAGCRIGEGSVLHAGVTLYDGVTVGARAILHSGCVIGADGFGFVLSNGAYRKFPQIGTVVIEDDVEIGANSTVDRAALGETVIGQGTKLDNMVHIGHNCRIGKHVVIAAQTGLSGGVTVEDYAVIGGQVGIGDKARIEARAVLGSGCGILTSKIVRGGQVVWGTPARPLKEHLTQLANLARLPAMREELEELRRRLAGLEAGK